VIDTATNAVASTITVGPPYLGVSSDGGPLGSGRNGVGPIGLALSPNGALLYVTQPFVTSPGPSTLSVIDTATNTVVATVPVPDGVIYPTGVWLAGAIAVTPNGAFVYVTSVLAGVLSVFDTATNALVTTVPMGGLQASSIAFTPDGAFAYISNQSGTAQYVIDTATYAVINVVDFGGTSRWVAITPNGASAYFDSEGLGLEHTMTVFDIATASVVAFIGSIFSPRGLAITPDSAFVYVASVDGNYVNVIDTATNTVVATVPVGFAPVGVATLGPTPTVVSWSGVLPPINADGSSIFKLGSTIPVKFQLTGTSAGITDLAAKVYVAKVSNSIAGTEQAATSTSAADSGNTFRYDSTSGQYIFNLATKSLSAGTWQVRIDLGDGTLNTVLISLTK
jgi:YVTN family beta-propeller protein